MWVFMDRSQELLSMNIPNHQGCFCKACLKLYGRNIQSVISRAGLISGDGESDCESGGSYNWSIYLAILRFRGMAVLVK